MLLSQVRKFVQTRLFKKSLPKVLSGIKALQADLKEIVLNECEEQVRIDEEVAKLEERQAASVANIDEANQYLGMFTPKS